MPKLTETFTPSFFQKNYYVSDWIHYGYFYRKPNIRQPNNKRHKYVENQKRPAKKLKMSVTPESNPKKHIESYETSNLNITGTILTTPTPDKTTEHVKVSPTSFHVHNPKGNWTSRPFDLDRFLSTSKNLLERSDKACNYEH